MSQPDWAVAIQSKNLQFEYELGTAICRCLRQLGRTAVLVQDGDPKGFEADRLLILINLGNFAEYCRRLKTATPAERPVVVLWQLDPLLPADAPQQAEAIGLSAARWKDLFQLHQSTGAMPRWKKFCTAVRLREWACKQCSAPGYRKACRLIKQSNGGQGDFDWPQIRGVMENWRNILDAHRNKWVDHFVVSTNQRLQFLAARSVPAHFVPVGAYEELGRDLGLRRDIQVGFLGNVKHGRRAVMLERLSGQLKQKGVSLTQVVAGCHGEERCEWLNRTRILVNLHNFPWNPAWIRFLMAASCRTLVVSEPMNDDHPMIAGVHYVAATLDEMPETILKLLDDPAAISRITRAAADLCQNELTLLRAVESVTTCVEAEIPELSCQT